VKAKIKVGGGRHYDGTEMRNEFSLYIRTRKICSMDAFGRFLGFQTYPGTKPRVKVIKAQFPETINLLLKDGKVSNLLIYLCRPKKLKNLTYQAFYQLYCYKKVTKVEGTREINKQKRSGNPCHDFIGKREQINNEDVEDLNINDQDRVFSAGDVRTSSNEDLASFPDVCYSKMFKMNGNTVVYKLCKRKMRKLSLTRLEQLTLRAGELAHIQILLGDNPDEINEKEIANRTPTSFMELRTVKANNTKTTYNSYQEASIACGIVKNPKYVTQHFKTIIRHINSSSAQRKHFFLWTKEDYPTLHIFNDGDYDGTKGFIYKSLVQDWIDRKLWTKNEIKNMFLRELDEYLSEDSSKEDNLGFYGFPAVVNSNDEVELEKLKYDIPSQERLLQELLDSFQLNEEQRLFWESFIQKFEEVRNNKDGDATFMFLNGPGGSGKTTLLKLVAAFVRAHGEICKVTAATGLAATNYEDASTFHSFCKLPIVEGEERDIETHQTLKLNLTKKRLALILATLVVIIDELPFNHRECMESFYNCEDLQKLKGKFNPNPNPNATLTQILFER